MEFEAYLEQLQEDAEHHGSGAFSVDLQRMQSVLGSHQLAWPEEYVLCVLSAAVLGGATFLRLEERRGCTRLVWDGQALELEGLFSHLGRSNSGLGELALAVLSARRLGEVELQSEPGRLFFRGEQPVVESGYRPGPNSLSLQRRWWKWLGRIPPAARILRQRARFAPLQVQPGLPAEKLKADRVFFSGAAPPDWVNCSHKIELAGGNWGFGFLTVGQGAWQLIRHGVTHSFAGAIPGFVVYWWSDRLPLDLSRKELRRGAEFEAWLAWLHEALAAEVQAQNLTELLPNLVQSGRYSQQGAFLSAPLFRMANGSRSSLSQLRDSYRQHGWLPVISRPMIIEWEPERVAIVQDPHEQALLKLYANWLNLDHLENVTDIPRLPADEDYIVRMPFFKGKGEAGLRRYPQFEGVRVWADGAWQVEVAQPYGVDIARNMADADALPLGELYWTLKLMSLNECWHYCRVYHLLAMFALLKIVFKIPEKTRRRHPIQTLLEAESEVLMNHCRGNIASAQLREMADQVVLHLRSGQTLGLLEVAKVRTYTVRNYSVAPDCLLLDIEQQALLASLFSADTLVAANSGALPVTTEVLRLIRGAVDAWQVLRRILNYKRCSAYQQLEVLGLQSAVFKVGEAAASWTVEALLDRASKEMRCPTRRLSTAYVLLALTQLPELEFARIHLLPLMQEWAGFEVLQEDELFASLASTRPERARALWLSIAVEHLYSGKFHRVRESFQDSEEPGASELMLMGISHCLEGNIGKGLELHRRAASLNPESGYATCVAEALMWLGRREAAQAALPHSDEQYTLMIRANLEVSPEASLEQCERVAALGEGQYFELAEARGLAYHRLGHHQEAAHWLRQFLQARVDNSWLTLRHKRMAHARELLAEMGQTEP